MGKRKFNLLPEHVTLIRQMNVQQADKAEFWETPFIDSKRPFGNPNVERDIVERHLGWELFEDAHGEKHISAQQYSNAREIFQQLGTALQIVLECGTFEPGSFEQDDFYAWRRIDG